MTLLSLFKREMSNRINEMKKQQKMQKDAWKAKQTEYQQKKLLAPNLHDIFGVFENAHKCVYPKYKLEGILQFLDTKSIVMLSSTCKNFKKTIFNTNYINHPIHLKTRHEIMLNNERKIKFLENEKKVNQEYLARINKKKHAEKIHKQLVHIKRFNPEKFEDAKINFSREWKQTYNKTLLFSFLCGTEYGILGEK